MRPCRPSSQRAEPPPGACRVTRVPANLLQAARLAEAPTRTRWEGGPAPSLPPVSLEVGLAWP